MDWSFVIGMAVGIVICVTPILALLVIASFAQRRAVRRQWLRENWWKHGLPQPDYDDTEEEC